MGTPPRSQVVEAPRRIALHAFLRKRLGDVSFDFTRPYGPRSRSGCCGVVEAYRRVLRRGPSRLPRPPLKNTRTGRPGSDVEGLRMYPSAPLRILWGGL